MLDHLPIVIHPINFSIKKKSFSGSVKISQFTRLSDLLFDNFGVVDIDISFDTEGKLSVVQGKIKATLTLICQGCLDCLAWSVDKSFKLGMVKTLEQADELAADCEPFILADDNVVLVKLVEDELLLALPDFPRHKYNCVNKNNTVQTIVNDDKPLNSNNPFSILAQIKNTGD